MTRATVSDEMKEVMVSLIGNHKIMAPLITTMVLGRVAFKDDSVVLGMFYNEMADKLMDLPKSVVTTMHAMLPEDEVRRIMEEAKAMLLRNTQEMREAEALDEISETDQAAELLQRMFQQRNTDGTSH